MGGLSDRQIDVTYAFIGEGSEATCARLSHQLPPEEQQRAHQYLLFPDRLAFLTGRVLIRRLLALHTIKPQGGWRLLENANGKPFLAPAPSMPDLRFNLSHTHGLVAAAVSLGREIGIDVELVEHELKFLDLARAHFSIAELELLSSLPEEQRRDAFFSLWTLKEAYTKAVGTGLSVPLSAFSFSLNPPTISFHSQTPEEVDGWIFWQDQPSSMHRLAIAAQRRSQEELFCSTKRVQLTELY